MDEYNFVSAGGIVGLMAIAWVLSANHRRINWRVIIFGLALQLAIGALVFLTPGSRGVLIGLNDAVVKVITAAQAGQEFVFGPLATKDLVLKDPDPTKAVILATQAFPMVIFFAALMALLYYWRIMPLIIRGFAWLFTRLMRISGAESLCTASNIFVGVESATTVRPYLPQMTRSELCTILTAGMATVASTTLAIYVLLLKDTFPTIAGHLISASLMSAPAAIVMSKLIYPETAEPLTLGRNIRPAWQRESGAIDSIISGAMAGVKLLVGIVALLIAFLGLIAIVDLMLAPAGEGCQWVVNHFGPRFGCNEPVDFQWSLATGLAYLMYPFAVAIGVPPADALLAGRMLGERMVATEIPAYLRLAAALKDSTLVHPRSAVVFAYALCGFAHVASLAFFIGGIAALVPERRRDLAAVGLRALLAATLACLMTGAVAGAFFHTAQTVIRAAG